jgi:hypothetical protein
MVTYTSTYNLKLPVVGQDDDAWGGYVNDNTNALESLLTGTTTITNVVITTADINGGTLDNVVIGGTTAAEITGTTITGTSFVGNVTGNVSGSSGSTTGNAATATTAGTVTTAAQPNITSLGTLTTLTVDDITINGSAISDSGDFYIDVGGDIILDADGGDVYFRDGGTTNFQIKMAPSSAGVELYNTVSNEDLRIILNDGGSNVTALTLDASEAGAATFNAGATFGGDVNVTGNISVSGTVDGVDIAGKLSQDVRPTASPTFNNVYVKGEIYHDGDTDTYIAFANDTVAIDTGGSARVYVNNAGVRLGDTGNGYFRPVSGSYGSIEIDDGGHNGWEGYSIGGRVVFMHDNSSTTGLYNDVDNEWLLTCGHSGAVGLYHNGSNKFQTNSGGVNIDGDLNAVDNIYVADKIYHEGDTDTYIGFGTNTIDVYTGGTNTWFGADGLFLTNGSVREDYDALSGTSPNVDVNSGGGFSLTTSGNTTFTFTSPTSGYASGFVLQVTAGGTHTLTWPSSVDWAGASAPDAPASGESNLYVFYTRDGGSNWIGVLSAAAYG